MMIVGWESRILLVSAWYSSRDEEAVLQDKDCRETTLLLYVYCMSHDLCRQNNDRFESMYIRQSQREDLILKVPRCTSLVHFTLLEKRILIFQEIYRPTRYRLQVVCRVYGWCQKRLTLISISCCCCTNTHHMQYLLIELRLRMSS